MVRRVVLGEISVNVAGRDQTDTKYDWEDDSDDDSEDVSNQSLLDIIHEYIDTLGDIRDVIDEALENNENADVAEADNAESDEEDKENKPPAPAPATDDDLDDNLTDNLNDNLDNHMHIGIEYDVQWYDDQWNNPQLPPPLSPQLPPQLPRATRQTRTTLQPLPTGDFTIFEDPDPSQQLPALPEPALRQRTVAHTAHTNRRRAVPRLREDWPDPVPSPYADQARRRAAARGWDWKPTLRQPTSWMR